MNVAEIEDAVAQLADKPFAPEDFFLNFMEAYAAPPVTVTKMRKGDGPKSDIDGAWLWRNKVHAAGCPAEKTDETLQLLQASKKTKAGRVRYVMAFDGQYLSALDLKTDEPLFCPLTELPDHFAFFLPLAGYERYQAAEENPVDIRATARLAKLYDALLRHNPDWADADRQHDMNAFMTRVIFCLFAEDTGIFPEDLFTKTIHDLGGKDGKNVVNVLSTAFEVMSLAPHEREGKPAWATAFPYVNGGLFDGSHETPVFNKTALNYLIQAGRLDWKEINPDIFGSMIQAIVDVKSRGGLGMHYTSVPNILMVLDPLLLHGLRKELDNAKTNAKRLNRFLARLERIRVFDPACGSGNFLVIAYRELRTLEIEALRRLGEATGNRNTTMFSRVSLNNFYGIEYADFAAETAKLSLWVAEYQMNKRFEAVLGKRPPDLPLRKGGHIICANALRIQWVDVCPLSDKETFIVGNPPFKGTTYRSKEQRVDMDIVMKGRLKSYGRLDYVAAWHIKAGDYVRSSNASYALVSTSSIVQGSSVPVLWPDVLRGGNSIRFAHLPFKWRNNAAANAAVTCVIVGVDREGNAGTKQLFEHNTYRVVDNINPYLANAPDIYVRMRRKPLADLPAMGPGNFPYDFGHLILNAEERETIIAASPNTEKFIRPFGGSEEVIHGLERYCLWIDDSDLDEALWNDAIRTRVDNVRRDRLESPDAGTQRMADRPHQFREHKSASRHLVAVPRTSSENRPYLPVTLLPANFVPSDNLQIIFDGPEWTIGLIASRLHLVWIAAVCGKLENRYRYANTLGWHTFPTPKLSEQDKTDLMAATDGILGAREAHFPKTLADLYDLDTMPQDLLEAHQANDEVVEKICAGRTFRNDTERLEYLFKRYVRMSDQEQQCKDHNRTKRETRKKEAANG